MATIAVHVVPRSRSSEVAGEHGDAIRIRIAAPPEDGAANRELCRFLAERLRVPRRAVTITRGATGRRKTVEIDGLPTESVLRRLLTGALPADGSP